MYSNKKVVMVIGDYDDKSEVEHICQIISKAREIADELNSSVEAVSLVADKEDIKNYKKYGAGKIITIDDKQKEGIDFSNNINLYLEIINKVKPYVILVQSSMTGKYLATAIATKLESGLVAECTNIKISEDSEGIIFTRPAFNASIFADIKCSNEKPQMCTVKKNIFELIEHPDNKAEVEVIDNYVNKNSSSVKVLDIVERKKSNSLEKAKIVIGVGRGIGKKENMKLIYELSKILGAEVAATRSVVEIGWLDEDTKVGLSGITISPDVYIAIGISGAIQHMTGITKCKCLVAINNDKNAEIFNYANYKIVDDWRNIVSLLMDKYQVYV